MTETFFTPVPEAVGVEITSRCDLACRHCFNLSGAGRRQELSLDDLMYLFDQVQAMGLTGVRISGGEPTLHPDFPAIIRAAVSRGLRVSLNTNGLYAPRTGRKIADLDIALFLVSLDGLRSANDRVRGTGVFDRVVATVRWLRSLGRKVIVGAHLNHGNVADVEGLIALAAELGADIKFAPLRLIGRARELMADEAPTPADFCTAVQTITRLRGAYPRTRIYTDFDILQPATGASQTLSPSRASCPAGRSMLNVSYDGYVYPCAFLATPQREFAAGHLREAPLLSLWRESPVFDPFRTLEKDVRCRGCFAYGRACVGGCVAVSYFVAGRLDARDPTCFVEHVRPPEAIRD